MAENEEDRGRQPANRQDVIAALRRHGVAGAVAAKLWRLGADLRSRTRRRGLEHAVTLDLESGEQPGQMLTGTAFSTDLSPHLRNMRADREYVVLHTHPRSTSLSDADVLVLTSQSVLAVMVIVGVDQTWYIASLERGARGKDPRSPFDAYRTAYRERVCRSLSAPTKCCKGCRPFMGYDTIKYGEISMNSRIHDAYYEYRLEQVLAGTLDDSLTEAPDDGRSMDERIIDILRAAGRLPEGWEQEPSEPARQSV